MQTIVPKVPGSAALWQDICKAEQVAPTSVQVQKFTQQRQHPDQPAGKPGGLHQCLDERWADADLSDAERNRCWPSSRSGVCPMPRRDCLPSMFDDLNSWYPIFVEFPALDDASITQFHPDSDRVNGIQNPILRVNVLGSLQAEIGIWQILARQKQIPGRQPEDLVAEGRSALLSRGQFKSSSSRPRANRSRLPGGSRRQCQSDAGSNGRSACRVRRRVIPRPCVFIRKCRARCGRYWTISIWFQWIRSLGSTTGWGKWSMALRLATACSSSRGICASSSCRGPFLRPVSVLHGHPYVYVNRHAELQVRTDLTKVIKTPGTPAQLEVARARLRSVSCATRWWD